MKRATETDNQLFNEQLCTSRSHFFKEQAVFVITLRQTHLPFLEIQIAYVIIRTSGISILFYSQQRVLKWRLNFRDFLMLQERSWINYHLS